ncbi:MAG: hypothetical protein Q9198_004616, partial [Flavoplaca austrocitrina]
VAKSGEDGADGVLADGRVVEGRVEGVGSEDGRAADARDDKIHRVVGGTGFRGGEGLGYGLQVTDVAADDGQVGVEGLLGDGAFEEKSFEFGG